VGGGNTVYFASGAGNAVSLYSTGGVWDLVDGSGATVYLANAQAAVAGGADTIDFGAGSGNAASLYNTGGSWDLVNGSFATIYLINAQTALVGGGDSVNFADGSGNAISIYGSAGNWDSIDGSQGSVYLNNAQAGVAGNGNTIYLYGTSAVTQSGATDAFIFQPAIGQDTINGFVSTDFMQFSASDFANWAALSSHISQSGSNTLITYDASDNITLTNVTAASLSASQFHFI
jgi:hypothetical protein